MSGGPKSRKVKPQGKRQPILRNKRFGPPEETAEDARPVWEPDYENHASLLGSPQRAIFCDD